MSRRQVKFDDGRTAIVCVGKLAKTIPLTWFERLGRAVLDGASQEEMDALAADHFSKRGDKA